MPQYKTHTKFNLIFALPLFLGLLLYFIKPPVTSVIIFSLCFIYSTLFMNPDVDLAKQIKLFSIKGILTLPFRSYSHIFKHRGISHWFIFGSVSRILWLGVFFYLILFILDKPFLHKNDFLLILKSSYFLYGFSAIIIADFCHLILDLKKNKKT